MAKCNKDTVGNKHVARRFHYVRQGTVLNEYKFQWICSKFQLADILTKVGKKASFSVLWFLILHQEEKQMIILVRSSFCIPYMRGVEFKIINSL